MVVQLVGTCSLLLSLRDTLHIRLVSSGLMLLESPASEWREQYFFILYFAFISHLPSVLARGCKSGPIRGLTRLTSHMVSRMDQRGWSYWHITLMSKMFIFRHFFSLSGTLHGKQSPREFKGQWIITMTKWLVFVFCCAFLGALRSTLARGCESCHSEAR